MKHLELDFKGGSITWDAYRYFPIEHHLNPSFLNQDMILIDYEKYSIDLGWYQDRYCISIMTTDCYEYLPFYSIEVFNHDEVFDKFQETINNAERYYKLIVFT